MPKYRVTFLVDATCLVEVEADSVDEAVDLAYDLADTTLCHQCSDHVETGDIVETLCVYDENGDDVYVKESNV